jgi:hypothetical protein
MLNEFLVTSTGHILGLQMEEINEEWLGMY